MKPNIRKYAKFAKFFEDLVERHEGKIKRSDLAQKLGTNQPTISKIYSGQAVPSDDMVSIISELWGENIMPQIEEAKKERSQAIRGLVDKTGESYFDEDTETLYVAEATKPHIPTKASAGIVGGISETVLSRECERRPIIKIVPDYDYTMNIVGDSMYPKYENGDLIAIRKVVDIIEWGAVYVIDTADGAIVKRLYDDGDKFRCVSINKEYHDFTVDKSSVYGIYKVVGQIRI